MDDSPSDRPRAPGPPTKEEVDAFGCAQFLSSSSGIECSDLGHRVDAVFRAETSEPARRVLRFLIHLLSLRVRPDDKENGPLVAMVSVLEVRALRPSELEAFDVLLALPDLHPDVRARLLDASFLVKRGPRESWFLAPAAYVDAARFIEQRGKRDRVTPRLERAVQLARAFKKPEVEADVAKYIEDLLAQVASGLPEPEHLALTRLARRLEGADVKALASRCEAWATRCHGGPNVHFTRAVWTTAAETYAVVEPLGDDARRAQLAAAETYVAEADQAQGSPHMPLSLEAGALERAIQALRKLEGTHARREELHDRMLAVQRRVPSEYGRIEIPLDGIPEMAAHSAEQVADLSFSEAVFRYVLLTLPLQRQEAQQHVLSNAEQNMLSLLMPKTMTDGFGRVVQKSSGLDRGKAPENNPGLLAEMHRHARWHRGIVTLGQLEPARRQIAADHSPSILDVFDLVRDSPFIPEGRAQSFAIGFHAGFHGNCSVVAHVLVPQVENAIRRIVEARGGTVSTLTDDGIQKWTVLSSLLGAPEALAAFDADYLFTLRSLLAEEGSNLRNLVSHGINSDSELATVEVLYFWWFVLHLCMVPLHPKTTDDAQQQPASAGDEP